MVGRLLSDTRACVRDDLVTLDRSVHVGLWDMVPGLVTVLSDEEDVSHA